MLFFPQKPLIKTQIVYMEFHMEKNRTKWEQAAAKFSVVIT